jgi:hypothetical protein
MSQQNFDELCRRLLYQQPRKPDYDLVWTLICFMAALVSIFAMILWAMPDWPF